MTFKLFSSRDHLCSAIKVVILISIYAIEFGDCSTSYLSSYRTDNLKIKCPAGCVDIFDEAHTLMKSYFMYKDRFTENDWDAMRREFSSYRNTHLAR